MRCPSCGVDNPLKPPPRPPLHYTPSHLAETILAARGTLAIEIYQSMDMTFWLPRAEVVLVQVEGR